MKTKNFSGRKQDRRTSALERMINNNNTYPSKNQEIEILKNRIATGGRKFTKKDHTGKIGRNSR